MINKIIVSLIIGVLVLGAVGYWLYQGNSYSKEILRLEIFGPEKIMIGDEIEYSVRLKNNGEIRLDDPILTFEYPGTAQPANGESMRIVKESEELGGAIYPGQEKIFKFRTRIFGEQGEIKEAKAMVSYRPRNLKATYVSKTSHLATIDEVPLTFEFDIPSGVGSNQEMNFSLNYFSSIDYPLSDLEIEINYPNAFNLKETEPKGISNEEWRISHLSKAEGGRIDIKGSLGGETGTTEVFKAKIGLWQRGEFVLLKQAIRQVKIVEPSLYITQTINNSTSYTANPGDLLHYVITFRNIGNNPLQHLFLASKFNGELFDFTTIRSSLGQSQAGDNSIIWDWHDVPKLQFLDAGEEAAVEFWINLRDDLENISRARVDNEIILGQARRKFVTKVKANLELSQNVFIDDEIFGSQGKIPPKVGEKSTFTVLWRVKNYYNPVKDVKMQATLPSQVKLTGQVLPQKLTFDPITREIVWAIGDLDPNQGVKEPHQLAFQIELKPTTSQKGKFAPLVGEVFVGALDAWTDQRVEATSTPITTQSFGEEGRIQ
ncbi:MAG: hypothetical protein U9Q96_02855 [Patescibacteria group bacterium]|nr:hypothetical protein [Patescibacteria group bacterium]